LKGSENIFSEPFLYTKYVYFCLNLSKIHLVIAAFHMSEKVIDSPSSPKISFQTAIAIVIANMIGAGVFTSLGYQALGLPSSFPLLLLWLVGGIVALCGALSYGELAAMFPRSGGEYNYLSRIYHPAYGFLSGWVSATVGFAAPVALAAMALGRYANSVYAGIHPQVIAIVVVVTLSIVHSISINTGSVFQRYSTAIKVALIFFLIIAGLSVSTNTQTVNILPQEGDWSLVFSSSFAISLAFVSFAYSGWNASAYLANEITEPKKNVPRSLFFGTALVMVAYILLNFVFLYTVPIKELAAKQVANLSTPLEVGYLSAEVIFGTVGGKIMGACIALLLVSSISSMVFAGPRVTQVMGEDIPLLAKLATKSANGLPVYAILLQSTISITLILTTSFDAVLYAIAFVLDLFTFSTVLGLFVMRIREPKRERIYAAWGYPISPAIFLLATGWTMYFLLTERTQESLIALALVLLGLLVYIIDRNRQKRAAG